MGRSRQKVRQSKVDCIVTILIYIILVIIGLMTLFPFMDVVFNSLTSSKELVENAKAVIAIPKHPTLENYKYVLSGNSIFRAYGVTVFRTVVGTLLNLVITVMTAYPLSKKFLPGRNVLMQIFFFTMIFSGGMIPTYLVVKTFKLSNTIWALIIPSLLNVYNMIIMRTFFEGISEELEDAARIDGCSEWKTLLKIVLPVSKPTLASIALFYAVWHWNSFFDVVLYITDRKLWPLQTLLREVVLTMSMAELNAQMADVAAPPSSSVIAATVMVSTVPILAVYPFLQKYFVKGVMVGAVKG
ncbi:carbohydrate ABC transporter permease [uncultured Acetatifactor sp.]|uniref:carbohydrate ABC transporter permease n=1 Tax=uncultured Acetatifactor sp. TaxID=1671927 RepID=UPI0025D7C2CB|nr:carbohydrate ABC transporter permease [uncultured Acetatifactor sp.]MCI8696174.1 carbohydrate ABC transporter permease [Lachnospiraceae bacterium]MCI9572634.1 carbohydrate ABC transporter permease [Lachnospiraceae bacterium]